MHRNRLVVSMQVSPLRKFNERDEESFIWKTVCIVLKRENFYNFIVLYVVKKKKKIKKQNDCTRHLIEIHSEQHL